MGDNVPAAVFNDRKKGKKMISVETRVSGKRARNAECNGIRIGSYLFPPTSLKKSQREGCRAASFIGMFTMIHLVAL